MAKITVQEALNLTPGQIKRMSTQEIKEAGQVLFDAANKRYRRLTSDSRTRNTPMAEVWKEKAGKNAEKGLKETPFSMKNYKTKGVDEKKARDNARKALSEGQNALSPDKETNTLKGAKAHREKLIQMGVRENLVDSKEFWKEVRKGLGPDGKGPGGMESDTWIREVSEFWDERDDLIDEAEEGAESEYERDLYEEEDPDQDYFEAAENEDTDGDAADQWIEFTGDDLDDILGGRP